MHRARSSLLGRVLCMVHSTTSQQSAVILVANTAMQDTVVPGVPRDVSVLLYTRPRLHVPDNVSIAMGRVRLMKR